MEGFFCNLDSITKKIDFKQNSPAKKMTFSERYLKLLNAAMSVGKHT